MYKRQPLDLAVRQDDNAVSDVQNPLLMGDDEDGAVDLLMQVLKHLDEVAEGPQVNARLRLVKDRQLGLSLIHISLLLAPAPSPMSLLWPS